MSFRYGGGRGGGRGRGRGGRSGPRQSKMMGYVNWRMRVTISDTRTLLGTFRAYDKHMNIILDDCEEYRKIKGKKAGQTEEREEKRSLGLVLLRGENVISMSTDTPPAPPRRSDPSSSRDRGDYPGSSSSAGRGMPVAPLSQAPKGLSGPVRGMGGPSASMMAPQIQGAPVGYGHGAMPAVPPAYGGGGGSSYPQYPQGGSY